MDTFEQAATFLRDHHVGVLSTISPTGDAWGAAIYFTLDDKLDIYFLTQTETDKYRNLKHHSQAAVTVFDDELQTTVQLSGTVSEVPIGDENNEAYQKLAAIQPPHETRWASPISKTENGNILLMKLTTSLLRYSDFNEPVRVKTVIPRPAF